VFKTERDIQRVIQGVAALPRQKRVAAYARVSSGKDAMLHSLSSQVSYYSEMIQRNPEWRYAGVYADEGITGTKTERPEFLRLLADCRSGRVDMVVTKSISRFSRNTLTLLETARELKGIGVDIYFEEQNIHTLSGEGELMLTLLASFAQEESLSVSENCKWRIRNDYKQGKVCSITMLGYRRTKDGGLEIEPREAEIVRMIFTDYLNGMGAQAIANKLNETELPTRRGLRWHTDPVHGVLTNEKYTGDMLLQKVYHENHLTKKTLLNNGVLPQYFVEGSHEAIIDKETFAALQEEMGRRAALFKKENETGFSVFTGTISCGCCGKHYHRKLNAAGTKYERPVWICATYDKRGKKHCPDSRQIPEDILYGLTAGVLGMSEFNAAVFARQIVKMTITAPNEVTYRFRDGHESAAVWQDRPRSKSWTEEMRRAAGDKTKERLKKCRQQQET